MAHRETTVRLSGTFSCDKPDCDKTLTEYFQAAGDAIQESDFKPGYVANGHRKYHEDSSFHQRFANLGWTHWVGTRQTFEYCPDHGPSKTALTFLHTQGKDTVSARCWNEAHAICSTKAGWTCACSCHAAPAGK